MCDNCCGLKNKWLLGVVGGGFVFFYEGGGAYYVEGHGLGGGGLEDYADWEALPFRWLADGDEVIWLGPGADLAGDYGAAGSELSDYGYEAAFGGG